MTNEVKINKKYLLKTIQNYITTQLTERTSVNYNHVKTFLYEQEHTEGLLSKKKNSSVYLDNLLKYDRTLRANLESAGIKLDGGGFFSLKSMPQANFPPFFEDTNFDLSDDISESDLRKQFCPYIELITRFKQKSRVSYKSSKTNERVLNYMLNKEPCVNVACDLLDDLVNTCNVDFTGTTYFIRKNNRLIMSLTITDKYIDVRIDPYYKRKLKKLKKIYPFSFFTYFYIMSFAYVIGRAGYKRESKYISIKLFDIMIDKLSVKYFSDISDYSALTVTMLYDIFYKDKIQTQILDDYKFINDFFTIFYDSKNQNYVSFIIGQYKVFTYLKNKYNREIKNIALELYEAKNRSIINKIIGLNDSTSYSNEVENSEIISNEEIMV